jgi:hypothetical protein
VQAPKTTVKDKATRLAVQNFLREAVGDYGYFEIGSHLCGSLVPHLADPACTRISSVDLRPEVQRDEGRKFASFFLPGILNGIAFGKLRKPAKKAPGPLAHDPE